MTVARYLKDVKHAEVLGLHGESMGGAIACYIASRIDVNFMLCDRTFSSLDMVAQVSFGSVARVLLRLFTRWDLAPIHDYLSAE